MNALFNLDDDDEGRGDVVVDASLVLLKHGR